MKSFRLVILVVIVVVASVTGMSASIANKLRHVNKLQNQYFALRHGNSLANQMKIISSDPAISTVQHGLSCLGHEQARNAATKFTDWFLKEHTGNKAGVAIFSSDFTRARETAEYMAHSCNDAGIPLFVKDGYMSVSKKTTTSQQLDEIAIVASKYSSVNVDARLRERYFGEFNGGDDSNYNRVWQEDTRSAEHNMWGVESVASVTSRVTSLVLDIENTLSKHDGKEWCCLLVAHGDVLQITQTAFCKLDGSKVWIFFPLIF